jgi:hypothetical protein
LFLDALLCVLVAAACAKQGPSSLDQGNDVGYVVVGPSAARTFQMVEGDTLYEMDEASIAEGLRFAAHAASFETGSDAECTRYFRRDTAVLVLLVAFCDPRSTLEDGLAAATFTPEGHPIHGIQATLPWDFFDKLFPAQRLR